MILDSIATAVKEWLRDNLPGRQFHGSYECKIKINDSADPKREITISIDYEKDFS